MKKLIISFAASLMLISIVFSSTAFGAGGLAAIQSAENESAMESAIRDTPEMSDEAAQMDAMKAEDKASLLDSVYRRRYHYDDIAGFKAMFADQYAKKSTYMHWAEGYPYVESTSVNGASVVVKTDIDGWIYVTSFADNVVGGISDEYSFMKFYNADNGQYKNKVWIEGGIETRVSVASASSTSGVPYRIYMCLRTDGNESGFTQINYKLPYKWTISEFDIMAYLKGLLESSPEVSYIRAYDISLRADDVCTYRIILSLPIDFVVRLDGNYTKPTSDQSVLKIAGAGPIAVKMNTTVIFDDDSSYSNTYYLPFGREDIR